MARVRRGVVDARTMGAKIVELVKSLFAASCADGGLIVESEERREWWVLKFNQ